MRVVGILAVRVLPIVVGRRAIGHGGLGRIYGQARIAEAPVCIAAVLVCETRIARVEPIRDALPGRANHVTGLGIYPIADRECPRCTPPDCLVIGVCAIAADGQRAEVAPGVHGTALPLTDLERDLLADGLVSV